MRRDRTWLVRLCLLATIIGTVGMAPAQAHGKPGGANSGLARGHIATAPLVLPPSGLSVRVAAVTTSVTNAADSATPAVVACPAGTALIGGGIHAFFATGDLIVTSTTYEPVNGLVRRGTYPSDAAGATSTATNPAFWTGLGGFAGQSESGDDVTGFAMCATGVSSTISVVATTVNGPTGTSATAATTATCPGGSTLVGGGALMGPTGTPGSSPSQKPVGSYPSDASGSTMTVSNPTSWTAVGQSGGQADLNNFTTAFALCASGLSLATQVVRADDYGHPAGQGNANPGQDPVATATATCPTGTIMLGGGDLADSSAPGGLQQGVHVRGDFPSTAAGIAVADGTAGPTSWTSIEQSGGQATPDTNTHAFALCTVNGNAPTLDAVTPPLDASTNVFYAAYTFEANGTPTPTVSLASGLLPPGLSLASNGVLTGTPTTVGAFSFTVRATNTAGTATSPTITITVSVGLTYSQVVLGDGPLDFWRLDDTGTVVADSGPGGHNGSYVPMGPYRPSVTPTSVSGATPSDAANTGKQFFTNEAISVAGAPGSSIVGDSTVEGWFQLPQVAGTDSSDGMFGSVLGPGSWGAIEWYGSYQVDTLEYLGRCMILAQLPYRSLAALSDWHYLAVVISGSTLTIYVDSGVAGQCAIAPSSLATGVVNIGSDGESEYTGALQDVAVYNKALTLTQIDAHIAAR